jgi:hypothetical protein
MLLFKLFASSDNATKYPHQIESPSYQLSPHKAALLSANNEQKIFRLMNEVEIYEHSLVDNSQLPSSKDLNKSKLSLSDNRIRMDKNSTSLNKKFTRINHYPNMLTDLD